MLIDDAFILSENLSRSIINANREFISEVMKERLDETEVGNPKWGKV